MADEVQTADLGEIIGGYRLERELGRGGMGSVFAATHVKLDRRAAVKLIATRFANDEAVLSRFLREAKVVNNVRHPNIVDIFDFVEMSDPRRVACIMEYIEGPSLKDALKKGSLSPRQAVNVALQLASALEAVHAIGIVHRDLKPANVMIVGSLAGDLAEVPSVKLLDFGIAKVIDSEATNPTEAGAILGTPAYMAPEQIGGDSIGPAADVYALGEVIFEMIAGRVLFAAPAQIILRKKLTGEMPDLSGLAAADRWEAMRAIVVRCLAHDPSDRPSLPWLRDKLTGWLDGGALGSVDVLPGGAVAPPPAKPGDEHQTTYSILTPQKETLSPPPQPRPRASSVPPTRALTPSPTRALTPAPAAPPPSSSPSPSVGGVVKGITATGELMFETSSTDEHTASLDVPGIPKITEPSLELDEAPGMRSPPPRNPSLPPSQARFPAPRRTSVPPARTRGHSVIREVPRPKRRGVRGIVLAVAAIGIAVAIFSEQLIATMTPEPIKEIARRVMPQGPDPRSVALARENPLAKTIAEWKDKLGPFEGEAAEHLAKAKASHLLDRFDDYASAQESIERALIKEQKHPEALAFYAENVAIWKGPGLPDDERRIAKESVDYASALAPADSAVLRSRAALALADRDFEACRRFAEQAIEQAPGDGLARLLLATAFAQGDADRAVEELERAATLIPNLERRHLVMARARASGGRYRAAMKIVDDRMKVDPKSAKAMMLYGDFERELANKDAAIARYRRALKMSGDRLKAGLEIGILSLESGAFPAAEESFRGVLADAAAPAAYRVRANVGLARAAFGRGKAKDGDPSVEAALAIAPRDDAARFLRAEISFTNSDVEGATQWANAVLASRPGEPGVLILLARIAFAKDKSEEAIARASEALRTNPHDARLRAVVAGLFFAAGARRQLHDVVQGAAKLDPMERADDQRLVEFDLSQVALTEAIGRLDHAVNENDLKSDASALLALLERQEGRRAKAKELFQRALKADSTNVLAKLYEAELSFELGEVGRAETLADKLIVENSSSAIAHLLKARIRAKQNRVDEAKNEREIARRLDSSLYLLKVESAIADLKSPKMKRETAVATLEALIRERPRDVAPKRAMFDAGF